VSDCECDKGYYTRSFLSNGGSKRPPVFTLGGGVTSKNSSLCWSCKSSGKNGTVCR